MTITTDFPDVSKWQREINFDKMRSKTDYIILRSGQANYTDYQFERNRSECVRVGLPFGIYHYYDDRFSPGAQANALYSLFSAGQPRPAELWCDWENTYNGVFSGVGNVVAFMQRVEQLMGMQMGMYTGYFWFMDNTNTLTHLNQLNYLKQRMLWLAWYAPSISFVKVPRPWTQMNVWQYGTPAIGEEYGVESIEIDMNERVTGENPDPFPSNETMMIAHYENSTRIYKEI